MRSIALFQVASLAVAASACAAKTAGPSTVSGTAALSTFPSHPLSMAATDETGRIVKAAIGSDSRFSLALTKGHTYKLGAVTDTGTVPIVFPRASGKLDATFVLKTNGARISLGSVHYVPAAPAGGFRVLSVKVALGSPDAQGSQGGNCVDCVNDDQQTSCENGSASGNEGEGTSSENESSSGASDKAEQADPSQEMAVGDQNAPDQVDGCDNQEGDNSNVQQEGEH
jgi:hypothetical protein